MITSDYSGKIAIYDNKNFNLICKTDEYVPTEDGDEMKVINKFIINMKSVLLFKWIRTTKFTVDTVKETSESINSKMRN